jgi:hypothetical protein
LATKLKTSQPQVAKIERAAPEVSFDQLVRAFTAAGGKIVVKPVASRARKRSSGRTAAKQRVPRAVHLDLLESE